MQTHTTNAGAGPSHKTPYSTLGMYLPWHNPSPSSIVKFPLQFLFDFASAVLDNETGDLLEYQHLLKHPKYKDIWSKSIGKEI
jgi:hypothetical protein